MLHRSWTLHSTHYLQELVFEHGTAINKISPVRTDRRLFITDFSAKFKVT